MKSQNLAIKLFGHPHANLAPELFPKKAFLLFALLACAPDYRLTRNDIARYLWRSGRTRSLVNLRQLLTRIRRAGLDEIVVASSDEIRLGSAADAIDLFRFSRLSRAGSNDERMEAILLYRADLLQDLKEPTEVFGKWLATERAALNRLFFSLVEATLMDLTSCGRSPQRVLVDLKDHVLEIESGREASYRLFIEAFGRNGMDREARQLYDRLVGVLARENARPAPETCAIMQRVSAKTSRAMPEEDPGALHENGSNTRMPRLAIIPISAARSSPAGPLVNALLEDVGNQLARFRTFTVVAQRSTGSTQPNGVPFGNTLPDADYAVTGAVDRNGPEEVLSIRLIDCQDRQVVLSGEYSFRCEELVKTFNSLSAKVASRLSDGLESALFEYSRGSPGGRAYRYYLQGQAYLKNCTLEGIQMAREAFRLSLATDPHFGLPYGRIALTLCMEWIIRGGTEPQLLVEARQFAERSIELDRGGALGIWSSAVVSLYQHDFDSSAERFAEAEALHPNSADLLIGHGRRVGAFRITGRRLGSFPPCNRHQSGAA